MNKARLLTILVLIAVVISTLTPTVAFASSDSPQSSGAAVEFAKSKAGYVTVINQSGGKLYVSLAGSRYYFFVATRQGKTTFGPIEPGQYRITIRTNKCTGALTYRKNIKGNASFKGVVCNKK